MYKRQVVPHEVVGMANYSKNIFVGCGGSSMINSSHMLGAFYGMERVMGKDFSPVRRVFDYAEENYLKDVPLMYVLTVTTNDSDSVHIHGLFIGRERSFFEQAVGLSQEKNLTYLDKPLQKVVVYLEEKEFKSNWLGNKAVYRTRMAIADGGELIILAPGVKKFGEDAENDRLIRKYGYVGRENVLKLTEENEDLQNNLSVAAHLIHGSSDGRFSITYATAHLSREEVEGAGFQYWNLEEASKPVSYTHLDVYKRQVFIGSKTHRFPTGVTRSAQRRFVPALSGRGIPRAHRWEKVRHCARSACLRLSRRQIQLHSGTYPALSLIHI